MSKNDNLQWLLGAFAARGSELSESEKKILADTVLHGTNPQLPFPSYSVTVNYNKTVNQLVKDGKYDWHNTTITTQSPNTSRPSKNNQDIIIVSIETWMSNSEIDELLNKHGLIDANDKELFSLGEQHPDLQREGPIVARGSTWRDSDGVLMAPYLDGDESYRGLGLVSVGGGWSSDWRFACVSK